MVRPGPASGEAADTLISQGADVLTHHTDSTAASVVGQHVGISYRQLRGQRRQAVVNYGL